MSLYPILWAVEHAPVVDAEERAILTALVSKGDFDGCNCYRSYPTLARIARVDPKTAGRKCRAMESRGILRRQKGRMPEGWKKLPRDKRPVVWEVMVPAEFWSAAQLEEINAQRRERGRPPITAETRPPLPEAPPKKARADKGRPRPERRKAEDRGDSQSPRSEESGGTCSPVAGGLVVPSRGDSESPNPPSGPSDLPSEEPSPPRSVRSAHVGDARARDGAASGEGREHQDQQPGPEPSAVIPEPRRTPESAEGGGSGASGSSRPSGGRSASAEARQILGAMPRGFREDAPAWVLARLAERIDRMLAEGFTPAAILAAARDVPVEPGAHIATMRRVRAALTGLAGSPDVCGTCGGDLFDSGRCGTCDPDAPMSAAELAELEAARARLAV